MARQHPNLVDFECQYLAVTEPLPGLTLFSDISAGLCAFAGTVTGVRLVVRLRKRKWWWDDTLAFISVLGMVLSVTGERVYYFISSCN